MGHMLHWLTNLGSAVLAPLLVAGVIYIGHKVNRKLSEWGDMPDAINKLAEAQATLATAVASWEKYRHDTEERLSENENRLGIHDERLDQHGRMFSNYHQRLTVLEMSKERRER